LNKVRILRHIGLTLPGTLVANVSPTRCATVSIDDLRLAGTAYDSNTLRIIANANGGVSVAVSSLAMQ